MEMADPIVDDLVKLENEGLVTYDALLGQEVLVIAPLICAICDNPRASEITNHNGSTAKKFCRMCLVSICKRAKPLSHISYIVYNYDIIGPKLYIQCDRMQNPWKIGAPRSTQQALQQIAAIQQQPSEAQKKEKRTSCGLSEKYNPLFQLSVDLFRCSLQIYSIILMLS